MDFFGIGIGELLLIMVVTLIIWGPGRLPEIARTLGRSINALRKMTSDLTTEVTREITKEENKHSFLTRADDGKTSKSPEASKEQPQDSETTNLV